MPCRTIASASALVLEVARLVRRLLPRSIRMEPDIRPGLFVRADPEEPHQVLINLALNARDAMPEGGILGLHPTALPAAELPDLFPGLQGEVVSLVVEDTGAGMDGATRERIFEPLFTTKSAGHGTTSALGKDDSALLAPLHDQVGRPRHHVRAGQGRQRPAGPSSRPSRPATAPRPRWARTTAPCWPLFTTRSAGHGTGLGLSTVYEVVHGHGGHIHVERARGSGARFRVLRPAAAGGESEAGPRRGTAGPGNVTADRVDLPVRAAVPVVDDEERVRRSTARLLRQRGHVVVQAASGEEALEALDAGASPDGIVLDLDMPGMGGEACLEALRRLRSEVRVVLPSGLLDHERARALEARGAAACLQKPFEPEILERTIRRVLAETAGKS